MRATEMPLNWAENKAVTHGLTFTRVADLDIFGRVLPAFGGRNIGERRARQPGGTELNPLHARSRLRTWPHGHICEQAERGGEAHRASRAGSPERPVSNLLLWEREKA
jgi:hypothetical protein